jgi:hypothetical protein
MKITGTHLGVLVGIFYFASQGVMADQLTHKFKNPSFSGIGTGAHYLTIENQEKSRKDKIRDDIEAALRAADRLEDNSTINKFIRNLESRIYSQISKGLVDSMFCNPGEEVSCTNSREGAFEIEGSSVSYIVKMIDGIEYIVMTIVDPDGTITEIEIPIGIGTLGG